MKTYFPAETVPRDPCFLIARLYPQKTKILLLSETTFPLLMALLSSRLHRKIVTILILFVAGCAPVFSFDNSLFTQVLHDHVSNGWVDYAAIKNDSRFQTFMNQYPLYNPSTLSGNEKLAFWINAYNAWTLKIAIDSYPLQSFKELGSGLIVGTLMKSTIWDKDLVHVAQLQIKN